MSADLSAPSRSETSAPGSFEDIHNIALALKIIAEQLTATTVTQNAIAKNLDRLVTAYVGKAVGIVISPGQPTPDPPEPPNQQHLVSPLVTPIQPDEDSPKS